MKAVILSLVVLVVLASCVEARQKIRSKTHVQAAIKKGKKARILDELRFEVAKKEDPPALAADGVAPDLDCLLGAWTLVTSCNASCGGGYQEFNLGIVRQASGNGKKCPDTIKYEACHTEECPVDCECGEWEPEPPCPAACNSGGAGGSGGVVTVTRVCKPGNELGRRCLPTSEDRTCNSFPCPVNCEYNPWKEVGQCSAPCGGGHQIWARTIKTPAANGGAPCMNDELQQTQDCNTHPCPVDCEMTEFDLVGGCDKECNGGTQNLKREIKTHPENGGAPCPALTATQPCNTHPCPVNCVVSEWVYEPTGCSKPCGGGKLKSTRKVLQAASVAPSFGQPCPALEEEVDCNTHACPQDCVVGEWVAKGECSKTCDGGEIQYIRSIVKQKNSEGAECPILSAIHPCNTDPCYTSNGK